MPKITLRKGAKAEPGTEIDTLLRNVLGDPDEAEDVGPIEEPAEAHEGAGETGKAAEIRDEDDPGSALLSLDDVPAGPVVAEEPLDADQSEEPVDPDQTDQREEPLETDDEEQPVAAPAPDEAAPGPASDETVPEPPPAPERHRGETLQDFVDDLLGEPEREEAEEKEAAEEEEEENLQDLDDNLSEEPEREGEENLQDFVDDLLETLDE